MVTVPKRKRPGSDVKAVLREAGEKLSARLDEINEDIDELEDLIRDAYVGDVSTEINGIQFSWERNPKSSSGRVKHYIFVDGRILKDADRATRLRCGPLLEDFARYITTLL